MYPLLNVYIIKKFLKIGFTVLISFLILFIAVDAIDNIDKFIENNISKKEITDYYIYTIPYYCSIAFPMSLLIATVFTFGSLQKNNELTAIKSSGISIRKVGMPLLLLGIIFSFALFFFDNLLVTNFLDKRAHIDKKLNSKKYKKHLRRNIDNFYIHSIDKNINQIISLNRFNIINETGRDFSIQTYNNSNLKQLIKRVDAKKIIWQNESNSWELLNYEIREWDKNNKISFTKGKAKKINLEGISPQLIIDSENKKIRPEEMNYWELTSKIENLKKNNLISSITPYKVNKFHKTAFCCIPFIMILFGISLSIQKPRSSYALGVALSLLVIFSYMVLMKVGQNLGWSNTVPPFISVWLVNFIFLLFGGILFFKART